ncbi:MAG: hypothetical protein WDW38_000875 [Sanguina aurantia]
MKSIVRGLYKTLMRQSKKMDETQMLLSVRKPLDQEWGSSCYSPTGLAYVGEAMTQLATQHNHFPPYSSFPGVEQLSGRCVRDCLKLNFREYQGVTDPAQQMDLVNGAFQALRVLSHQQYLQRCTSSTTTDGIQVEATSSFNRVNPEDDSSEFTYRIRVTNHRDVRIQVLSRRWNIKNSKGEVTLNMPWNSAVVGQTPLIPPGHCFEYHSGTVLDHPPGEQSGALMVAVFGNGVQSEATASVEALISTFPLIVPSSART